MAENLFQSSAQCHSKSERVFNLGVAQQANFLVQQHAFAHNSSDTNQFRVVTIADIKREIVADAFRIGDTETVVSVLAILLGPRKNPYLPTKEGLVLRDNDGVQYELRFRSKRKRHEPIVFNGNTSHLDYPPNANASGVWFDLFLYGERIPRRRVRIGRTRERTAPFSIYVFKDDHNMYVAMGGNVPSALQGRGLGTQFAEALAQLLPDGTLWVGKAQYPSQIAELFGELPDPTRVRQALTLGKDGKRTFLGRMVRQTPWTLKEIHMDGTFVLTVDRSKPPIQPEKKGLMDRIFRLVQSVFR